MTTFIRAPKVKTPTKEDRENAIDDASKFLMRRRLHAGRPSTLRKLRKFARIADMVRPAEFKRKLKTGERQVLGAHGWQDAA